MTDNTQANKLRAAYRAMAVMFGLVVGLSAMVLVLWTRLSEESTGPVFRGSGASENLVRQRYPTVQFTNIYRDMTPPEIDLLQRECLAIRYVYEPFVQFLPLPVLATYVRIDEPGVRRNRSRAPWPPDPKAVNVFVFGGSTTLGYHLRDDQTVPAQLETELRERLTNTNLWCYNLGSGYHFSSQERARFAALLTEGILPRVAIFIDGLNEFYHPEGVPQYTFDFRRFSAPDTPAPNRLLLQNHKEFTDEQREPLIESAIARYQRNILLSQSLADRVGVKTLFVAQPVPFHAYALTNNAIHPFHDPTEAAEDRLCQLAYPRLRDLAANGVFGANFLWAGELFKEAETAMYADKAHYSPEGARVLAGHLADMLIERALLPQ